MKKAAHTPIHISPAALWDGIYQLSGILELWEHAVIFRLDDFKKSHLNLTISHAEIASVEEFLVYDLARNGLRIQNKDSKFDLFVLEDAPRFKRLLEQALADYGKE